MRNRTSPLRRPVTPAALPLIAICLVSAAHAQTALTCTAAGGMPPLVRYEGLAELAGDILMQCTGGTPTPVTMNISQANLTVSLNVPLTSRILGLAGASEALLLVDEPGTGFNPSPQLACPSINGCTFPGTSTITGVAGPEPYNGSAGPPPRPNIFEGAVTGNSVTFFGVPIDPPGAGGVRILRITNIRANVSTLAPPSATPGVVSAQVSVSGGFAFPIANAQQTIGFVQTGFTFSLRTPDNQAALGSGGIAVAACANLNKASQIATLRFSENFVTASKVRTAATPIDINTSPPPAAQNVPGSIYNTESGFYNGQLSSAGLADFGTRLKVTFRNIPAGVGIWVTTTNLNPTASKQARLVAAESSPFVAAPKTETSFADMRQLAVADGTATAVWEVLAAHPGVLDQFDFGVSAGGVASPAAPITVTAAGTAAPAQPASFPLPRFADLSTQMNLLQTLPCSSGATVAIAIRPEDSSGTPAAVNPRSHGRIPVAILSSAGFDAPARVNPETLTFGRSGTEASLASCNPGHADVNRDGRPDLMCHFRSDLTGLKKGDTSAVLKGLTIDGAAFSASGPVRVLR